MREEGIRAKSKRKFRVTTDSKHNHPVAENHLDRKFHDVTAPNQVWLGDITYISTKQGWLYLAVMMDMFTRKIIGWSMNERMTQDLTLNALETAYKACKPLSEGKRLIHHTDRGSQYAAIRYQKLLWKYKMQSSMSRKGNCWDNSPMESFFRTLKVEHVYHETFETREEAKQSIFEWIEGFYNRKRIHSSLGYKTPIDVENNFMLQAA